MIYELPPHNQIRGWDDILMQYVGYKEDGFFVEVGAFDGVMWSPCRSLAVAGWSGIFFEPLKRPFGKLLDTYRDNKNIVCINKAISDFTGLAEMFVGGSVSTLEKETRDLYMDIPEFQSTGHGDRKVALVCVSVLDLELATHCRDFYFEHIDVVSIDVEGSELKVLSGFSLDDWKPTLVVVEAHEQFGDERLAAKAVGINRHMHENGYGKIYSDHINNIYLRGSDDTV